MKKYNEFINQLETHLYNEKMENQPLKVEIKEINNEKNTINITLNNTKLIPIKTQIELDNQTGKIIYSNKKQQIIQLDQKESIEKIQKNKEHYIINKDQKIILEKIEKTYALIIIDHLNHHNYNTLDTLLFNKPSKYEDTIKINENTLNKTQNKAVTKSINTSKFHIIQGPPGTGKTHTITVLIKHLLKKQEKILICAHTHIAVDNILEKLDTLPQETILRIGNDEKIGKLSKKYTLQERINQHPRQQEIQKNKEKITKNKTKQKQLKQENKKLKTNNKKLKTKEQQYTPQKHQQYQKHITQLLTKTQNKILQILHIKKTKQKQYQKALKINYNDIKTLNITQQKTIQNQIKNNTQKIQKIQNQIQNIKLENNKITAEIEKNIIEETPLIATTILSSTNTIINEIDYTYLIIDEASQVPIYLALIPLLKTEKFILVGDDKQLQPITNKQATHLLNQSIFHHMKHKYLENHTFLETQYRMNKEISQIASKLYYQKRLKTNDKNKNIQINIKLNNILLNKQPITYINTANTKNYEENINSGCINKKEAQLIKDIIETLLKQNIKPEQIGIISPYKKQQKQIQKIIQNSKIETDTIYRFQGREKDIIIISFCKSNLEQLKPGQKRFISQTNQLNVSITRAKKKLIIIGDYNILQQTKNTKELIKSINPKNIIHLEIFN